MFKFPPSHATTMDANLTPGRLAGLGLGVYLALAGAATLVGMPWQYTDGGAALAALRILGGVLAVGIGAAVAWMAVNVEENERTNATR